MRSRAVSEPPIPRTRKSAASRTLRITSNASSTPKPTFLAMPYVSVVMPCFNHDRFVGESIQSILNQSHSQLQLIIVDDCSSDDSRQVILDFAKRDPRVTVVFHDRNRGASRSRNDGIRMAEGDFIAFCDADDLWLPNKLAVQLDQLHQHAGYGVAYCDATIVDETGRPVGSQRFSQMFPPPANPSGSLFADLCLRNFINTQTVMIRKDCLAHGDLFDEKIKWVEDWWCWISLSRRHLFYYSTQPLAMYRVHTQSTCVTQRAGYDANRYKVLRRVMKRCPELSPRAKAEIWYHMGVGLYHLGKGRLARRFFLRSLGASVRSRCTLRQCARAALRFLFGVPGRHYP